MSDFDAWMQATGARTETALQAALPAGEALPQRLHASMRYAALGGGKRVRPLLVHAAGELTSADPVACDAAACAVEMVHAYSLVHDDMPCMDDDDLRRGQPTVHVAFDEATAILAGDALQTRAFEVIAAADAPADLRVAWLGALAHASGAAGMCGGQALDIDATGRQQDLDQLQTMHALKTGALIRAAVRMGALAGRADEATLARLDEFAAALGLAFQIRDDILDIEADSGTLGKTAGKDQAQNKSTFPALLGLDGAKARLAELGARMQQLLAGHGEAAAPLAALARLAIERKH